MTAVDLSAITLAVVLFSLAAGALNWLKYATLRSTSAYDLGAFHNQAFNAAHDRDTMYTGVGAWFKPGDREGPSVYRSNHFSPLRLLILPQIYRVRPRITTLMALQGLLSASARSLFLACRSKGRAAACSAIYWS